MAERVVFGKHAVMEALEAGLPIRRLYVAVRSHAGRDPEIASLLRSRRVQANDAPRETLDRLAGGGRHQGIVAVLEEYRFLDLPEVLRRAKAAGPNPILVACDQITDPHNLGAILRSTEAFGGAGAILPERRNATITSTVEKTAAGATAHLAICQVVNLADALERAKEEGFWVVGADAEGGEPTYRFDFRRPTILVIGAEGKGMRDRVRSTCDALVTIPLAGKIASLNASVAAGVLLYEIVRQKIGA